MQGLPLHFRDGHLFVEIDNDLWLLDTGAPSSFGSQEDLTLMGEAVELEASYLGLDAEKLSTFTGVPCAGLLGADVLGRFDHIFDVAGGTLAISKGELSHEGREVAVSEFMGIPVVSAGIAGSEYQMFFDTGAQVSYLQDDSLGDWPSAGSVNDFYPGVGPFETDTHHVPVSLNGIEFTLRCGTLPGLLGMTLMMAGAHGIIGNQILTNRIVGYFPRRRLLVL